jgi:hypothetical protein
MRFWIREIAGWLLVGLGLYLFLWCLSLLSTEPGTFPDYFAACLVMPIGIVVFRGGIHLLKVAVAARICLYAESQRDDKPLRN